MFLTVSADIALAVCLLGIAVRAGRWFVLRLGPEAENASPLKRFRLAARSAAALLVRPRRLGTVFKAFLLEILLQVHVFRQDRRRWLTHIALFYGIVLLLVIHAFDGQLVAPLFHGYASTRNPWMFLRNVLGVAVLAGVLAAFSRRRGSMLLRQTAGRSDWLLLALLAGIILTGACLEAARIISPAMFNRMVDDYMGAPAPEQVVALKSFWAKEFDVAFHPAPPASSPELLARGRRVHENYCAMCHSRPVSAILAYPVALAIKPASAGLERIRMHEWLYYAHFLVSCLALALLPFTKMFHVISTPASLAVRALGRAESNAAENRPTRRALGIDACTHCGVCTRHCAVAPVFRVIENPAVLPSEKPARIGRSAAGRNTAAQQALLAEGGFLCTDCGRCTKWCPSGIDLQDLWEASRQDLARGGHLPPGQLAARHNAYQWAEILKARPDETARRRPLRRPAVRLSENPDTFWSCVQCSTCTNVCPLVAACDDPGRELEMTPQQVMNLMRLQLREAAMGSRMVWECLTCYKCQEYCPQGVRVTDILYELRNEMYRRLGPTSGGPGRIPENPGKDHP